MNFGTSPVIIINILLCFIINLLGYLIYKKEGNLISLNIGLSFGLFGISHIITALNIETQLNLILLLIRFSAYFLIIKSIYKAKISYKFIFITVIFLSLTFNYMPYITEFISLNLSINIILTIINALFCMIITITSLLEYKNTKNILLQLISLSFLIFTLSNFFKLIILFINLQENFVIIYTALRIAAYLIIILGIYHSIKEKSLKQILKYSSNTKIQIITIGLMILTIISLFYYPNKLFLSSDPQPIITPIKPNSNDQIIKEAQAGLFIKNFPVFDVVKNEFIMNAIVWFEFDPRQININSIKDFSFEKGKILEKSELNSKIINNNLWIYYKVKVEFTSDLDYKYFPIEDHKIYLTLVNTQMDPKLEALVSYNTNLVLKEGIFTGDWRKISEEVEYGYIELFLDKYEEAKSTKYPAVSFELSFEKIGSRKALVIFIPLFMVFFLSLLSLLVNINNTSGIISLSAGSTSALIFNLIAIESMSPNVRYFTIANKIYILLLIFAFLILLTNVYIEKNLNKTDTNRLQLIRNYAFYFSIIFILLIIYSILY